MTLLRTAPGIFAAGAARADRVRGRERLPDVRLARTLGPEDPLPRAGGPGPALSRRSDPRGRNGDLQALAVVSQGRHAA